MASMVQQIHHSGITVSNMEESVRFYGDVFGFKKIGGVDVEVDKEGGMKGVKMKISFLKAGEADLELIEYLHPEEKKIIDMNPWDTGVQHLSLKVSNIRDFYDMYKDSIAFLTPPVDFVSEEIDTTWTYLKDPNGTILELSEDRKQRVFKT
jgi:catechol 2,3-dioxygenase-like lactoylglutathione lyase family enzyme